MSDLRDAIGKMVPAHSDALQCNWLAWVVGRDGLLSLYMPPHNVADMHGAIKTAKLLCPSVLRIDTYSGDVPDTTYVLSVDGWIAYCRRPYLA